MKTNSFLLVASLAVITSTASAAANRTDANVLVLPTYVVTAPRVQAVEQNIKSRLNEFRQEALTPMAIVPELTLLNERTMPAVKVATSNRSTGATSVAKS